MYELVNETSAGAEPGEEGFAATVTKLRVFFDSTGRPFLTYAVLTPMGVIRPLVNYFLEHARDRSVKWALATAQAVALLVEYLQANPEERRTDVLLAGFGHAIARGTVGVNYSDPSGLFWQSRSTDAARRVLARVNGFLAWRLNQDTRLAAQWPTPPWDKFSEMVDEAAYQLRREKAFLGHAWAPTRMESGLPRTPQMFGAPRVPQSTPRNPPAFPERRFFELLNKGFYVGGRRDYRGMCITLLLHGAGFRESEPMHLFVEDVQPDPVNPKSALVAIHHPSEGKAPGADATLERMSRSDYLATQWGLAPRHQSVGYRHSGWKGGLHETIGDSKVFRAHWFPPVFGELFLQLWHRYLEQVIQFDRDHPYAFINLRRAPFAEPYTLAMFNKAHCRAVQRIGLVVSQELGTARHGHRHAYGQRLKKSNVSAKTTQICMHHTSISSQDVYTRESEREVYNALAAGAATLQQHANYSYEEQVNHLLKTV